MSSVPINAFGFQIRRVNSKEERDSSGDFSLSHIFCVSVATFGRSSFKFENNLKIVSVRIQKYKKDLIMSMGILAFH